MGVVRLWLGADLRRRWRLQLGLALLVGFVGAVVLTVAAGARATSSSYNRFVAKQAISDVQFDSLQPDAQQGVAHLPGVKSSGVFAAVFLAPNLHNAVPGQDFIM